MVEFEEDVQETDVHFDRAILERLHRRQAPAREERAWLLAPDEDAHPLPAAAPLQGRLAEPESWRALHEAVRRMSVVG